MKAAFALLADRETFNFVSRAAWQMHARHGLGIGARRLPPHVSLKQPFEIGHLEDLEAYAEEFAAGVAPFAVELDGWELWEYPAGTPESGVLSLRVRQTPSLRALHDRLNAELAARFGERETRADFDGETYRFHLTIAAGGGTIAAYRRAFAQCRNEPLPVQAFTARALAIFVYDDAARGPEWEYMTYRILPLPGAERAG